MSDFLLELRSEEIPARMQAGARADLEKLFRKEMDAAGIALGELKVWSTPRRLALIARDLPQATAAVSEEIKGPRVGAPPQALEGFLRKTGLTEDQLIERDGVLFAISEKPGRATNEVLAEAIPAIVRAFPWPKSQRWGAASIASESLRWVRPLSGIVAILGEDLVECEVGTIRSGYVTRGHRFHCPGEITIGGAGDYAEKLRACHVIVDHAERQNLIRAGAARVAAEAGLTLVEDEGLVIENAGLTEWPVPLLGRFDEAFLDVPPEVIQLTARTNQKYFVCNDAAGRLANAFVCTANIVATDGGAEIVAGNRKVLAARLSDARFFWEQDRKVALAEQAKKLERITFHEKLGTVADKVERVAKLARWLVEEGVVRGADADQAEQAARLCKADLVTEMVGEFPELQGLMGGYYARAEGLPDAVADAIRDHYKPVGQGDDVPTAPVTVAVALADKLDTLAGFYFEQMPPTGSKDPFALRRAALSVISLVQENKLRLPLADVLTVSLWILAFEDQIDVTSINSRIGKINASDLEQETPWGIKGLRAEVADLQTVTQINADKAQRFVPTREELLSFFADRLKVQQREAGVRHDLIDAVFALGGEDDLVRLLARVHALQAFVGTADGTNLLAGYKRAANILKKEGVDTAEGTIPRDGEEDPFALVDDPDVAFAARERAKLGPALSYTPEKAEKALIDALDAAGPKASAAVTAEDFTGAMAALAMLRSAVDAFFDEVTVNDADPVKRQYRLWLLARFRDAVHQVADFSRIEG
ncbi:glycyl-tRNA synthetase beta chain [Novosphingobium kunmingense]|uniref:Glycine--tRNA ligase beta subunit n=1 Tax=Novosphingobium kunmingense TaxID=1211806 RepID=A0A2N0I2P7_9SPHN|nr:glycine--tRNA ligase subunit beta [Novosphingobium kunmingense]PKB25420.1 glycyl-tRNA synthetase beta chain [Novosphingobium kunmingense]